MITVGLEHSGIAEPFSKILTVDRSGCRSEAKILEQLVKLTFYPRVKSTVGRVVLPDGHTILK